MFTGKYKKIIFVHKGAFGDFLQIWPTIYNLVEYFKEDREFFWGGREEYYFWLNPLNIKNVSWKYRMKLDNIYANRDLCNELKEYLIIWFILNKKITNKHYANIIFFKGLIKGIKKPVWKQYLKNLETFNLHLSMNWREKWQDLFVKNKRVPHKITIFPGSGHRLKNWPVENFIEIANILTSRGEKVEFVFGPAEIERQAHNNLSSFNFKVSTDFATLQNIILSSKVVIGNDSGPMHLAGFDNVPSVVIFGPTDPLLWAPISSLTITPNISCAPCTSLIDIKCDKKTCLTHIRVKDVLKAVEKVLGE